MLRKNTNHKGLLKYNNRGFYLLNIHKKAQKNKVKTP